MNIDNPVTITTHYCSPLENCDKNSGLLVATDVTVNGVKQRVSKVTYDDLGHIASVVRGNGSNSGGTVSYSYNLHGQTTAINGPGFTQKLHYTDGPGKPLYNGSISSMLWTMGSDATQRGYKYTYNGYNWLTLAEYGEGATLSTHKDRYTERFSEFMLNGGIRRLQRHGLKADGNYGKIDNLHISYNGNRITTVLEDADPVTQSGSMDYPGAKREMRFGYNDWGALVSDESRGIEAIEYDSFGNPVYIKFSGKDYTKNVYSAMGVKLATEHYTHPLQTGPIEMGDEPQQDMEVASTQSLPGIISPEHHLLAGQQKIEYRGPVIYRNFKIDMVLFPGGYATIGNDNAVTFHYYTQDYLGSNRAVVNGSTGAVEQTIAYYPYGGIISDIGTGRDLQPFSFGGKELISANGTHEYDLGARRYWTGAPQFTTIDKLCEEFYWLSPYLYCGNNPVNAVDRDGNFYDTIWDIGNIAYDVGAAIVNHVKGDHASAASNWADAAFDTGAALIPFVPAGASKIGKAAKAIDKASDAKSAGKGLKNAAAIKEGKEFEKQTIKELQDKGENVVAQVTLVIKNGSAKKKGNTTIGDALISNKDGSKTLLEAKRSAETSLSPAQKKAKDHIEKGNKQFEVRSDIGPYKKGQVIQIDKWERKKISMINLI